MRNTKESCTERREKCQKNVFNAPSTDGMKTYIK